LGFFFLKEGLNIKHNRIFRKKEGKEGGRRKGRKEEEREEQKKEMSKISKK
jgi:hypothetical protein